MAAPEQFRKIKDIIVQNPNRRILVASAPGKRYPEDVKVTDLLLAACELAKEGQDFEDVLLKIRERYDAIISALEVNLALDEEIGKIRSHLQGEISEEYIASRGEYLNARILAAYLGFTFVDPEWCVCFHENGSLDLMMTQRAMKAALLPLSKAVIAGFYGADMKGVIHTFSRGGSDVTGSLAAAAVHADLYENWTDVSGLLAADPRIIDKPHTVKYISFRELRTLSYMGASVLHTDAVLPVSDLGIPINIRNTFQPQNPGTMIVRKLPKGEKKDPIVAVAGRTGMSVLQIEKVMVSDESGFTAIILDILKNRQLPFEQCLTGIDTVTLVIRSDLLNPSKEDLCAEIRQKLNPDYLGLKENLSMIAIIGEQGTEASDANVRVLYALIRSDIQISTINQGAGKLNLLIGVPEEKYQDAIRVIYETIKDCAD